MAVPGWPLPTFSTASASVDVTFEADPEDKRDPAEMTETFEYDAPEINEKAVAEGAELPENVNEYLGVNTGSTAKYKNRLLTEELNRFLAKELLEGAAKAGKNNICLGRYENMEQNQLSALAAQTAKAPNTLAALFSVRDGQTAYCICTSDDFPADAGELIQAVNALTGGKGGGRGTRAQGQARSVLPPESIEQLKNYFLQRLK